MNKQKRQSAQSMAPVECRKAYSTYSRAAVQSEVEHQWVQAADYWDKARGFANGSKDLEHCARRAAFCNRQAAREAHYPVKEVRHG